MRMRMRIIQITYPKGSWMIPTPPPSRIQLTSGAPPPLHCGNRTTYFKFRLQLPLQESNDLLFYKYLLICFNSQKVQMQYKGGLCEKQLSEIATILKKSIVATNIYASQLFQNQQAFLSKFANDYMAKLRKISSISHSFNSYIFFNQLSLKLKALTQLYFPDIIPILISQIKIKHKRVERFCRLIGRQQVTASVKIGSQIIRSILQEQSKLNMQHDLFILKCFIASDSSDLQPYKPTNAPLCIKMQQIPKQSRVIINAIHGYIQDQAVKIILANLPTISTSKGVFYKALESREVRQIEDVKSRPENWMGEDSNLNSKTCFHYFGHAMQFDFFNSLVQPQSLKSYIGRFSIIEDRSICQALIFGAINSLPNDNQPQFQDSEEEQEQKWQQQVQKVSQEFCQFFIDYFQDEISSAQVKLVAIKIASIRSKDKSLSLKSILRGYWLK